MRFEVILYGEDGRVISNYDISPAEYGKTIEECEKMMRDGVIVKYEIQRV